MSTDAHVSKKRRLESRIGEPVAEVLHENRPCALDALPEAVIVHNVLTCLGPADLCSAMTVSKRMRTLQEVGSKGIEWRTTKWWTIKRCCPSGLSNNNPSPAKQERKPPPC